MSLFLSYHDTLALLHEKWFQLILFLVNEQIHGKLRIFSFTKEILSSKFPFLWTTSIIFDITFYFCSSLDYGSCLSVKSFYLSLLLVTDF